MTTLRPLGVGSQILTHGDKMAGFYGEVNGIISANELRSMVGVTQGIAMITGDIAWLKFSHNYKTLYIAKQPIQHSISWDYLQSLDLVFGKMVEIGDSVYLLRLIQGDSINPSSVKANGLGEWNQLIVNVHSAYGSWGAYSNSDIGVIVGDGRATLCQEVMTGGLDKRCVFGFNPDIRYSAQDACNSNGSYVGWRPVLELLY